MQFTCDCGMPVFPPWPFQQVANVLGASESRPGPISQLLTSDRFREGCQGARALMASSEARALGLIMSWNSALCKPGWTPTLKPEYLDVCANSQGTSQPIGCSALIKALLVSIFYEKRWIWVAICYSQWSRLPNYIPWSSKWLEENKGQPSQNTQACQCSFSR